VDEDEPATGTLPKPSLPADTAINAKEVIDLTYAPTPPPSFPSNEQAPRKILCIGSIDTEALIRYPFALMTRGFNTEELVRARQVRVDSAGDEWLHVKCKWRQKSGEMKNDCILVFDSE
jgi:hypothetical protein